MNGSQKSFNTSWYGDKNYFDISGAEISGLDTQVVHFLSYEGTVIGSYNMAPCLIEFCGTPFWYNIDSTHYGVVAGTLHLTNVFEGRVTGDFNCTLYNTSDTNQVSLTNGHLDAIPHQ